MHKSKIEQFVIGDHAEAEIEITEDLVERFADFTGDRNPLHLDTKFAEKTPFKRRVVHGMSYGTMFSRLIGMQLPGPGALWTSQSFQFRKPVFIGDTLRLSVSVATVNQSTNTIGLECRAVNQSGDAVVTGESEVMILASEAPQEQAAKPSRRIALITGGSRGIGAEIARKLAARDFAVGFTYLHSEPEARALAESLDQCIAIKSDAREPADAARAVAELSQRFGAPDTLVLNAGDRDMYGASADGDFSLFSKHIDMQLRGPHALVSQCIGAMMERRFGNIIAVGSVYAEGPSPGGMTPYVVAKCALAAYTRCLAVEFGPKGIRANIVAPGMTETALLGAVPERTRKVEAAHNPLRRLAVPDDIAGAVAFLASDEAAYINGHTLTVSGGSWMG